jgi:hypothetical protein
MKLIVHRLALREINEEADRLKRISAALEGHRQGARLMRATSSCSGHAGR